MKIHDHFFKQGTVLSVPSYTIHRDVEVWGGDASVFRPERWFERADDTSMQKAFNPFSYGSRFVPCDKLPCAGYLSLFPRACVGRNFAYLELLIIISSVFRRFDIVPEYPDKPVSRLNHCTSVAVADTLIAQDEGELFKETSEL